MPILNLQRDPGMPEIARLRKGEPKGAKGQVGKSTDYFRFTPNEESDTELLHAFTEIYGEHPKVIDAFLAFPTTEQSLTAWMEEYNMQGTLLKQCDSQHLRLERNQEGDLLNYANVSEKPPCWQVQGRDCNCVPRGRLHLVMPKLGRWGMVSLLTGAKNDIAHLYKVIKGMEQAMEGRSLQLNQCLVRISRYNKSITSKENGVAKTRTHSLLRIEPHPEAIRMMNEALAESQTHVLKPQEPKALPVSQEPVVEQAVTVEKGEAVYSEPESVSEPQPESPPAPKTATSQEHEETARDLVKGLASNHQLIGQFVILVLRKQTKLADCSKDDLMAILAALNQFTSKVNDMEQRHALIRKIWKGLSDGSIEKEKFYFMGEVNKLYTEYNDDLPF